MLMIGLSVCIVTSDGSTVLAPDDDDDDDS
jgi:hypothetical protein